MSKRANGEGSIWKRPDGRYCAAALVNGRRRYVYARTREEVSRKLMALLTAQQDGVPVAAGRDTVATFFPVWLEGANTTLRPRTWERYEQFVRVHVIPGLGRIPLRRLQPHHLQRLYQDRLRSGLAPATVHQLHAVIHRALGQAERWSLVTRNVADLIDAPRISRREMRVLTAAECRGLLAAAHGSRWEALLTLAITTGMRQGELLALCWRDVDLERGVLSVVATVQRTRRTGIVVAEPKTIRSRRQVALTVGAIDVLRRHRTRQLEQRTTSWNDLGLVSPNRVGKHQEVSRLLADFRELLKAAGLPRIRFHDLRHTAATLMLGRSVHPKIASEMLGHSTVGITLDIYSHVTETMQRGAANELNGLLWTEPNGT